MIHDKENHRFILNSDGGIVQTKYRMVDEKTIEFYSTHTPIELRGKGLARKVVERGLDFAVQNDFKVIATCWYVAKTLDRNGN